MLQHLVRDGTRLPSPTRPTEEIPSTLPPVITDNRPWGNFEQYTHNATTTVKVITVAPGQRLSLQRHEFRDELWIVLDQPVRTEINGRIRQVPRGERIWIPRGVTHRLGNNAMRPVRVLEIAFGHFDEADIERLADDYAR